MFQENASLTMADNMFHGIHFPFCKRRSCVPQLTSDIGLDSIPFSFSYKICLDLVWQAFAGFLLPCVGVFSSKTQ